MRDILGDPLSSGDVPFPHVDDRLEIAATVFAFRMISWTRPILCFSILFFLRLLERCRE
jgi:hypothetical protein